MYMYVYVYVYYIYVYMCVCVCIYIYIYAELRGTAYIYRYILGESLLRIPQELRSCQFTCFTGTKYKTLTRRACCQYLKSFAAVTATNTLTALIPS